MSRNHILFHFSYNNKRTGLLIDYYFKTINYNDDIQEA